VKVVYHLSSGMVGDEQTEEREIDEEEAAEIRVMSQDEQVAYFDQELNDWMCGIVETWVDIIDD
jgi:hypothetical protein